MDSGNSGSMQSSSGGDEELDSRGESLSFFMNPSHFSSISAAPQPPFLSHQNPGFFDLLSHQNHDHGTQFSTDNDLIWSRGLRSDHHNYSSPGNSSSSSLQSRAESIPTAAFPGPTYSERYASRALPPQSGVVKNPNKRTRASRRAPTTVMTTDTTNFRQMVQEFTGIPAAPFSGSPYYRRLDLFSPASALRCGGQLDALGPLYQVRPSTHKAPSPFSSSPPLLNSNMIDAIALTTSIPNTNNNNHNLGGGSGSGSGASTLNNPNSFYVSANPLLNLQQHSIHQQPTLHLANLSGFLRRETASASAAAGGAQLRNNNDDNLNYNDGVEENLVGFDGNINSGDSQNLSAYNLNLAEKGMENVGSSGAQGTAVTSWISPSD